MSFFAITRSSESAIRVEGGDALLLAVTFAALDFISCQAPEGPALYVNFSGTLVLDDVSVFDCFASSQCGGISIYGNNYALVSVRLGSQLSFVETHSQGRGGCLCLFLAPNATFVALYTPSNIGMISMTSCSAGNEGNIFLEGGVATFSSIYGKTLS